MRPFGWEAVYGQQAAKAALQGALHGGRVGHAYLFSGPPGVGRRFTAQVFAAALLCGAEDETSRPCGRCEECDAVRRGVHPDLFRLRPEDDKILIDQVRALQQRAGLKTVRGRYKVFIVESIGTATEQAQNALLKVLEEPAGNAVFILVTDGGAPPLPTIVSRCLTVRFGPLSREDATRILRERFEYGDAAPLAAALGDGSVELGRRFGPDELLERRRTALRLLHDVWGRTPADAAVQAETWHKEREGLLQLLEFMQLYVRDALLCRRAPEALQNPEEWLVNFDLAEELAERARRSTPQQLLGALDALLQFQRRIAQNVGLRSALTVLFLDLAAAGRPAVV